MNGAPPASLEVSNVCKRFGAVTVISDLNLRLGPGAVCGIVGPNGGGKSTLLAMLSGQLPADSGSITVCGYSLAKRGWFSSERDARRFTSLLPDRNEALLELTGYEFLNLHYALRAVVPSNVEAELEQALQLPEFAGRRLQVLSQGQRKRVHLAGSVAGAPAVWLLDEPTNALDAETCRLLKDLVAARRAAGLITLAVTHDEAALQAWDAEVLQIEALQRRV